MKFDFGQARRFAKRILICVPTGHRFVIFAYTQRAIALAHLYSFAGCLVACARCGVVQDDTGGADVTGGNTTPGDLRWVQVQQGLGPEVVVFDKVFKEVDKAFRKVDEAFEDADKAFKDAEAAIQRAQERVRRIEREHD